ncbi:MAG: hypothetical protein ACSHX0_06165 [Akkermansiaceae bacterium]
MDRIFLILEQHDLVIVDCRADSTNVFLDYFGEIDESTQYGTHHRRLANKNCDALKFLSPPQAAGYLRNFSCGTHHRSQTF